MKTSRNVAACALLALGTCSGAPSDEMASTESTWGSARAESLRELGGASPWARLRPGVHFSTDRVGGHIHAEQLRASGMTGKGVGVGVIDSGLDVTHPDFRNADGTTRVRWFIDYGLPVSGRYPALEKVFAIADADKACEVADPPVCYGLIYSEDDINLILKDFPTYAPDDTEGHGTHVTGIAAGNGAGGRFWGVAPEASLFIVRARTPNAEGARPNESHISAGARFIFDRALSLGMPVAINMSLSTLDSPADGNTLLERDLLRLPSGGGKLLIAAAGNDGYAGDGVRQSVFLAPGSTTRVPLDLYESYKSSGELLIVVYGERGKPLRVGVDSPEGRWVTAISEGSREASLDGLTASVTWDRSLSGGLVPPGANEALVYIRGTMTKERHAYIRLEGEGKVLMRLAANPADAAAFTYGTRESSITLPAAAPNVIGVGCTVNRTVYRSMSGTLVPLPPRQVLDPAGGLPSKVDAPVVDGQICTFSGAGPGVDGAMKPEIVAPGGGIIAARSVQATPTNRSIFNSAVGACAERGFEKQCMLADEGHGISSGTSMASPVVTGVAALMLQVNPGLTQAQARSALMAGVHPWRAKPLFNEQAGAGEVDAALALQAVSRQFLFRASAPAKARSWLALSSDYVDASGSRPTEAIIELRSANGDLADFLDLDDLVPTVEVNGESVANPPTAHRLGPGVWSYRYSAPRGTALASVTFGALYRGVPIVEPKSVPIATDWWSARYPTSTTSACSTRPSGSTRTEVLVILVLATGAFVRRRLARKV
ncbi:MAG: S8 family serine peptidase [Polyangiaceae bacterium]